MMDQDRFPLADAVSGDEDHAAQGYEHDPPPAPAAPPDKSAASEKLDEILKLIHAGQMDQLNFESLKVVMEVKGENREMKAENRVLQAELARLKETAAEQPKAPAELLAIGEVMDKGLEGLREVATIAATIPHVDQVRELVELANGAGVNLWVRAGEVRIQARQPGHGCPLLGDKDRQTLMDLVERVIEHRSPRARSSRAKASK